METPPTFSTLIAGPRRVRSGSLMKNTVIEERLDSKIDGRAYGSDYVGTFEHHTGTMGPFGFYANFYDEK